MLDRKTSYFLRCFLAIGAIWVTCALLLPVNAASTQSASDLIDKTSKKVIAKLKGHPNIAKDPNAAYRIIKSDIAPHIDKRGMARSALGRQYWKKATSAQRTRFTNAFSQLVMRTYAVALAQYTNEKVNVLPLRAKPNASRVLVKTQIIGDGPPLSVNYRLISLNNAWKVYDFDVEGVSMLRSFRSQFSEELSQDPSLDKLISTIQRENRGKK